MRTGPNRRRPHTRGEPVVNGTAWLRYFLAALVLAAMVALLVAKGQF